MKKTFAKLAVLMAAFTPAVMLCACGSENASQGGKQFGEFSYNGIYLTEYAQKSISATEAKELIKKSSGQTASANVGFVGGVEAFNIHDEINNAPKPSESLITSYAAKYTVVVTTLYYESGSTTPLTKVDELSGLDVSNMLRENEFTPFGQLVAKNVIMFDELIDFMENENKNFKDSENAIVAPFKNIFTYHTDAHENLIVQTHDYSEIASSVGGGISCNYRQDTEIVYNKNLLIEKWQTSLGVSSATPSGTLKQGYILEMEFDWQEKLG